MSKKAVYAIRIRCDRPVDHKSPKEMSTAAHEIEALREKLTDLGYVNVTIETEFRRAKEIGS